MTGCTVRESDNLPPHFKTRFEEELKTKTLTGKTRVKRRHTEYKNSHLPGAEDSLCSFSYIWNREWLRKLLQRSPVCISLMQTNGFIFFIRFLTKLWKVPENCLSEIPNPLIDPGDEKRKIFCMTERNAPSSATKTKMVRKCISAVRKSSMP